MTSPKPEILVVDDERDLVWTLEQSLHDEGYLVSVAYDGLGALRTANERRPDLVILDIRMPLLDGLGVCCELRRNDEFSTMPILFLTERNLVMDRIKGFNSGGDDYLAKPFDLGELKARVRALLRRSRFHLVTPGTSPGEASILTCQDLRFDALSHQVQVHGKVVQLTPTECDLFTYLITHRGRILTSQQLAQWALGNRLLPEDASLVRWHIKNLRQKIESDPQHPVYILTVPHQGYILADSVPAL